MSGRGLILESYSFKDISHERVFGAALSDIEIIPLNRDITSVPVVYQNGTNSCVSCAVAWVQQWMEKNGGKNVMRLSWPYLFQASNSTPQGNTPSRVLKPAHKEGISTWDTFSQKGFDEAKKEADDHKIPNYSFLTDYSKKNIYKSLTLSPLAIGVMNWKGRGAHMMVAYDVTLDGSHLLAASWDDENNQTIEQVNWEDVEVAISFEPFPFYITPPRLTIHWSQVLTDKLISYFKYAQKN